MLLTVEAGPKIVLKCGRSTATNSRNPSQNRVAWVQLELLRVSPGECSDIGTSIRNQIVNQCTPLVDRNSTETIGNGSCE